MNRDRQAAHEQMRQDLYATIRRHLVRDATLTRHEVVEILAHILAGQIDIIRDDARKQPTK